MWRCAFVVTAFASVASAATPSFQGLGSGNATAVSADGSTVVGVVSGQPFRWTSAGGKQVLGHLPGGGPPNFVRGISGDGSVIVGYGQNSNASFEAFRWTSWGGMQGLGFVSGASASNAWAISGDGSVIAGASGQVASRWTASGGVQPLGAVGTGRGVNADGSVIVGVFTNNAGNAEAFRWTSGGGVQGLGDLPGGSFDSLAAGISADGSTIVGVSGQEAFRWTSAGGMQGLGDVPSLSYSSATAVSNDGSIIVGEAGGSPAGGDDRTAFIWDAAHGMRNLRDVLVNEYGFDLTDWTRLGSANGISADGTTIVGWGYTATGAQEAWRAVVPEPSSLSLLALAGSAMLRGRRRCWHSPAPATHINTALRERTTS